MDQMVKLTLASVGPNSIDVRDQEGNTLLILVCQHACEVCMACNAGGGGGDLENHIYSDSALTGQFYIRRPVNNISLTEKSAVDYTRTSQKYRDMTCFTPQPVGIIIVA